MGGEQRQATAVVCAAHSGGRVAGWLAGRAGGPLWMKPSMGATGSVPSSSYATGLRYRSEGEIGRDIRHHRLG